MAEYRSPFSSPESGPSAMPEQRGRLASVSDRLRAAATDPELRGRVTDIVRPYGAVAVQGAMIEAGVAKVDKRTGQVKIRRRGVIRAALRPIHTVRKALQGAVSETRSAVRSDVIAGGRRAVLDIGSSNSDGPQTAEPAPRETYAPTADLDTPPPSSFGRDIPPPPPLR